MAENIKDLGDKAAHPHTAGSSVPVTESRVDLAIQDMERLLELVNVV